NPTRDAITRAIATAGRQKPDRFVFYFAGHGTTLTSGDGAILPSDANLSSEYSLISTVQLYETVKKVPAKSRSVILDSCYSGAMMRSKTARDQGTARYYDFGSLRYSTSRSGLIPKDVRKRPVEIPSQRDENASVEKVGLA